MSSRALQAQRRQRVVELLKQGNTPKQIAARGIVGERTALRLKKKLLAEDAAVFSQ